MRLAAAPAVTCALALLAACGQPAPLPDWEGTPLDAIPGPDAQPGMDARAPDADSPCHPPCGPDFVCNGIACLPRDAGLDASSEASAPDVANDDFYLFDRTPPSDARAEASSDDASADAP